MTIFTSFSHLWSQFTQWLAKIWLSSIWETKPKLIIWSILKNFECWPKKFEVCLLFCAVCLHFFFKHIYFFLRQNAGLMSMCSASLDIFTMMEARQGAEISQPMRFVYFFVKYIMFVYFFWMFYIKNYIFFRQIAERWTVKRLLELWEDTQVRLRWNRKTKIWTQNECTKRYIHFLFHE